jgi:hypothetical protein
MCSPARSRVPSLSTNHVTSCLPRHAVAAASAVCVLGLRAAISPPRVEAAIVRALGGRSALLAHDQVGSGSGDGTGDGYSRSDDGGERNHID